MSETYGHKTFSHICYLSGTDMRKQADILVGLLLCSFLTTARLLCYGSSNIVDMRQKLLANILTKTIVQMLIMHICDNVHSILKVITFAH